MERMDKQINKKNKVIMEDKKKIWKIYKNYF